MRLCHTRKKAAAFFDKLFPAQETQWPALSGISACETDLDA